MWSIFNYLLHLNTFIHLQLLGHSWKIIISVNRWSLCLSVSTIIPTTCHYLQLVVNVIYSIRQAGIHSVIYSLTHSFSHLLFKHNYNLWYPFNFYFRTCWSSSRHLRSCFWWKKKNTSILGFEKNDNNDTTAKFGLMQCCLLHRVK